MILQNREFSDMTDGTATLWQHDDDLVTAAVGGSRIAFDALVQRYRRQVSCIVQRYAGSSEDVEDIVQQTFMKAYVNLPRFEARSLFSTWLISIARNEALMWRRKRNRRREEGIPEVIDHDGNPMPREFPAPAPNPETVCLQNESTELLLKCLGRVSPLNQMVVQLCDLEEQPAAEAAQKLGISVSAVKSRRSRGRAALRHHLSYVLARQRLRARRAF
jgi:RNA polymerase sigma-70 factor, ECF subfamily